MNIFRVAFTNFEEKGQSATKLAVWHNKAMHIDPVTSVTCKNQKLLREQPEVRILENSEKAKILAQTFCRETKNNPVMEY